MSPKFVKPRIRYNLHHMSLTLYAVYIYAVYIITPVLGNYMYLVVDSFELTVVTTVGYEKLRLGM